ncbi:MAG: hypothetical protein AAFX06_08480 [Planctomycetota bacterium]
MQFFEYDLDEIVADAQASQTGRDCWLDKGHHWLSSLLRSHTQSFVKCDTTGSVTAKEHAESRFKLSETRVVNFLSHDRLPPRKEYRTAPWTSVAFRALFQTGLTLFRGRLGDGPSIEKIASRLREGPTRHQQACLALLGTRLFDGRDPLPASWVACLAQLSDDPDVDIRMVALIAKLHQAEDLVSPVLAARERLELEDQQAVTLSMILTISDEGERQTLIDETIPALAFDSAQKWFREFAKSADASEDDEGRANANRATAKRVLDHLISNSSEAEFARFLVSRTGKQNFAAYASEEHFSVLKSISESATLDREYRYQAITQLARHSDPRDLKSISAVFGRDFDGFADAIGDVRDEAESEFVLGRARSVCEGTSECLGSSSVRRLWACGPDGKTLLIESMDALDLKGIQTMMWLVEGIDVGKAVSWLQELRLATTSPVVLRVNVNPKLAGPDILFALMGLCKRRGRDDLLPDASPNRLEERLRTLFASTANELKLDALEVASTEDVVTVSMSVDENQSSFEICTVDGRQEPDAITIVNEVAGRCETESRFWKVGHETQHVEAFWGPQSAIDQLIQNAGLARSDQEDDRRACRESCVSRIQAALSAKSSNHEQEGEPQ